MTGIDWMAGTDWRWQGDLLLLGFSVGDRVQAAPHLDFWMAGDRYGNVEKIGAVYLHVRMDRSGELREIMPENVQTVV